MKSQNFLSSPADAVLGETCIPSDKSISHRAIILGAIAQGVTRVNHFLNSDDCIKTIHAFQLMGIKIEKSTDQSLVVHGQGKYGLKKPLNTIDCGNSGTSMRLLSGLLAAQSFDTELSGDESLSTRPMERVSRPLINMGAHITTTQGHAPLFIQGGCSLKGISYEIPEASAQVKSCLLLAGLYAQGETTLIESRSTRDHTERMLASFSYPVQQILDVSRRDRGVGIAGNKIIINSASECIGTEITVPGDISSAAFFIVAATLIPGSKLLIKNVGINATRTGVIQILEQMGADIRIHNKQLYGQEWVADLSIHHAPLRGIDIAPDLVPLAIDEFPIIFIAAACAQGETRLHGANELRCKESDRIAAMVEGLTRLGIEAQAFDDGVMIQGGTLAGGTVDSFNDHRIAMAFAIAGAVAQRPIVIKNTTHVSTSFPDFVKTANKIGLNISDYS